MIEPGYKEKDWKRLRNTRTHDVYSKSAVYRDRWEDTGQSADIEVRKDGVVMIVGLTSSLLFHDEAMIELRPRKRGRR